MTELQRTERTANHRIYITGFPWLYASILQYASELYYVFGFPILSCRSCCTPTSAPGRASGSGLLRDPVERLGLAFAALLGFNLDPLVLVIPSSSRLVR